MLIESFGSHFLGVILLLPSLQLVRGEELQYCPFYNNRGPTPQPFLKNCTWYKDNACCTQIEIDYAFSSVKPPQGASKACQRQLNYLMCYICDPTQYKFYKKEYLYVSLQFCDNLYEACKDAILKGSVIRDLYSNGEKFCESRRFRVVKPINTGHGFFYDQSEYNGSLSTLYNHNLYYMLILLVLYM